jgi:hypothetical protein
MNRNRTLCSRFDDNNIFDAKDIVLSEEILSNISKNKKAVLEFRNGVRGHYLKCAKCLQEKSPINNKLIKYLTVINPKLIQKSDASYYVSKLIDILNVNNNKYSVLNEICLLQTEKLPDYDATKCAIDVYW